MIKMKKMRLTKTKLSKLSIHTKAGNTSSERPKQLKIANMMNRTSWLTLVEITINIER